MPGALEDVVRAEWTRLVASLAGRFGDLDLAEDAAGEAVLTAVTAWRDGAPPNPGGWLMTTATRKAIDRLRRESKRAAKQAEALRHDPGPAPVHAVEDDQLRLIFVCCHPVLAPEARLALTLRLVAGVAVDRIAGALLASEAAVGQRITRAKARLRDAGVRFALPDRLEDRLPDVLAVVYLIFTEGHLPGGREAGADLCDEAIRLARLLRALLPDEPEVTGLLALLLLTDARRDARIDADGTLVTLDRQDRRRWDGPAVAEGMALLRAAVGANRPGPYQLQAAIAAVHASAERWQDTDWATLAGIYDQLLARNPSPVVALNRAVVTAEVDGPAAALAAVDALPLAGYHAFHLTRAELLRRLGRPGEARDAYDAALGLARNPAEVRHLTRRRDELRHLQF